MVTALGKALNIPKSDLPSTVRRAVCSWETQCILKSYEMHFVARMSNGVRSQAINYARIFNPVNLGLDIRRFLAVQVCPTRFTELDL